MCFWLLSVMLLTFRPVCCHLERCTCLYSAQAQPAPGSHGSAWLVCLRAKASCAYSLVTTWPGCCKALYICAKAPLKASSVSSLFSSASLPFPGHPAGLCLSLPPPHRYTPMWVCLLYVVIHSHPPLSYIWWC